MKAARHDRIVKGHTVHMEIRCGKHTERGDTIFNKYKITQNNIVDFFLGHRF